MVYFQTVQIITMIEVVDNLNNGLRSDIVDGGIGEEYALIKLKSGGRTYPLDANIKIYGYVLQAADLNRV